MAKKQKMINTEFLRIHSTLDVASSIGPAPEKNVSTTALLSRKAPTYLLRRCHSLS